MAKQVKVAAVQGKTVITADGQRLRIIGNARPGGYVYTDGVVAYGFNWPGYEYRAYKKKKTDIIADFPLYISNRFYNSASPQEEANWWIRIEALARPYDTVVPLNTGLTSGTVKLWYGRPAYFNSRNEFFSLRGSWENPVLYRSSGGSVNVPGKRLLLGYDVERGLIWQEGNLVKQKATIDAMTYNRSSHSRTMKWDSATSSYYYLDEYTVSPRTSVTTPIASASYSLQGQDLSDLRLIFGLPGGAETAININPVVQDILPSIRAVIDQMAVDSVPSGVPAVPYPSQETAAQMGYGLVGGGYDDWYEHNYGYASPYHSLVRPTTHLLPAPACDDDTAKGGNPLYTVDFAQYSEYGVSDHPDRRCFDFRQIHNVRFSGNTLFFDLYIHSYLVYYPYASATSALPSTYNNRRVEYDPALPSGGGYVYRDTHIMYVGWWRVEYDLNAGTFAATELSRLTESGTSQGWVVNTTCFPSSVDFGNGYKYKVEVSNNTVSYSVVYKDGQGVEHSLALPSGSTFDGLRLIKTVPGGCLVFCLNTVYYFKNNVFMHATVYGSGEPLNPGYAHNDNFIDNKDVNSLPAFVAALANVPYYEL